MSVFSCANYYLTMLAFIKLMLLVIITITADVARPLGKWSTRNVILKISAELPAILLTLHFRRSHRIISSLFWFHETRGRDNFLVEHHFLDDAFNIQNMQDIVNFNSGKLIFISYYYIRCGIYLHLIMTNLSLFCLRSLIQWKILQERSLDWDHKYYIKRIEPS